MVSPLTTIRPYNAVIVAVTAMLLAPSTLAQNCYYPNGIVDATQSACFPGNDASACCPQGWECLSNGLCYESGPNYYGRYGCTDQSWNSSTCPQICAGAEGYAGNEAVMLCDDGSYCCDADRQHGNCCTNEGTSFFTLPSGSQVAYVSSLQPTSAAPSSGGSNTLPTTSAGSPTTPGGSQQSSSSSSDSSSSSSSSGSDSGAGAATTTSSSTSSHQSSSSPSSASSSSTFSQAMSTTTAANGSPSTIYLVSTVAATPTSNPSQQTGDNKKSSNLPLIIGLAAGIPAFLLVLAAILAFILLRRRRNRRRDDQTLSNLYSNDKPQNPNMTDLRSAHGATRPELDSYPVAPTRNKSNRQSELQGSSPTMAHLLSPSSVQNSPAMSMGSAPPQYSPTAHAGNLSQVREEEPQELWGGYVPYRVPRAELGDGERESEEGKRRFDGVR